MGGGGSKGSSGKAEKKRQAQITAGTNAINKQFEQFDPAFYQKRRDDYATWANPKMQDQYSDAQKKLTFALARQYGTLDTSEAAARQAQLAKDKAFAETSIVDSGNAYSDGVRGDVESQRNALIGQVQASADASAAAGGALRASDFLTHQQAQYAPLADFFANITEGLAAANYPNGLVSNISGLFKNPTANTGGAQTIVK